MDEVKLLLCLRKWTRRHTGTVDMNPRILNYDFGCTWVSTSRSGILPLGKVRDIHWRRV